MNETQLTIDLRLENAIIEDTTAYCYELKRHRYVLYEKCIIKKTKKDYYIVVSNSYLRYDGLEKGKSKIVYVPKYTYKVKKLSKY